MADDAFCLVWGRYRTWAATSRVAKAPLNRWRKLVLILIVAGAALGTLSEQTRGWELSIIVDKMPSVVCGLLSAIALALATFFTRTKLSTENERRWVRARSAAEAFKAQAFLYAAKMPPYEKENRQRNLLSEENDVRENVKDIIPVRLTDEDKLKGIPPEKLSVKDYINLRVNEQKDKFYFPKAQKHNAIVEKSRQWSLLLGAIAAILGAIAALFPDGMTAGWVPVLSTVTAAIASYFYAERHEQLALIYQATADRLESLLAKWNTTFETERNPVEFIKNCEAAISTENRAWMAKFIRR